MAEALRAKSLSDILDALESAGSGDSVSLRDVMHEVGDRSFAPVLLVVALILISPISGIPGVPTLGALVILLTTGQFVLGRRHLWLPDFLLRRSVKAARMQKAVLFLRKPARFVDRHSHRRLAILTQGPMVLVAVLCICALAMVLPLLELLPFVTSLAAVAMAFLALGMMVRDGVVMLVGYGIIAGWLYVLIRLI